MRALLGKTCNLVLKMYDSDRAIFSYRAWLKQGEIINDFHHRGVLRYTINTLAGLQEYGRCHTLAWDFEKNLNTFLEKYLPLVKNTADRGLLLYVLSLHKFPLVDLFLIGQ